MGAQRGYLMQLATKTHADNNQNNIYKHGLDDCKFITYNSRMYIKRDITDLLQNSHTPVQLLIGPRQCGKSTLLSSISGTEFIDITFDDLHLRKLANEDPKLFLEQFKSPVLLDEVQYVPNLFPEIKRRIDELKNSA